MLTNETVDELESISDRPQEIISVLPSKGEVEASMRRVAGGSMKGSTRFQGKHRARARNREEGK